VGTCPFAVNVGGVTPVHVRASRAIPVTVEDAYSGTLPLPLPLLFRRWYGPLPPIKEVRGQAGEWGTPGQTRTVALSGGGTMREELLRTDAPGSFAYRLTDITGPLALLVDHIDGEWAFAPVGTGTAVTWNWTIFPAAASRRPALVLVGKLWQGYARNALEELSGRLLRPDGRD
jgi:hypothetical protein